MSKYKRLSKNIEQILVDNPKTETEKITWYNVTNASKKEIEFLRKKFKFDFNLLKASLANSIAQRPEIKINNGYLFMILHFPVFEKNKISAGEIEFFVGHGYIVTIHNNNVDSLSNFFNSCKKDNNYLLSYKSESSAVLLYEILQVLMSGSYPILDQNSMEINDVDQTIFSQQAKTLSSQILLLKRNILNLRKIIQNHKNIFKKLMGMKSSLVPRRELKSYYISLIEHSKRIWEVTENQKEHVDALYTTSESLMNYRISNIMKILTIFTVVVLPLNLLASIFGMNFTESMPLINHDQGFLIMLAIMCFGSLSIFIFFARKRWL